MLDKSIDAALLALHKEVTRDGLGGLDHVEALLKLRGIDPPAYPKRLPRKGAYKGRMSRMVLDAMRGGHSRPETIARAYALPEVPYGLMYGRVYQALLRLERKGLVRREGKVWRLAP